MSHIELFHKYKQDVTDVTSERQIAANRRNGSKGGPKTQRGKALASMNALKHGLQAERILIPGEDPEEFEALLQGLEESYQPAGAAEYILIERIAYCTWRLQRANVIETSILRQEHFSIQSQRAKKEMERARDDMNRIAHAFDGDSYDEDPEEDESNDDHNLPDNEAKALWERYENAEKLYDEAKQAVENAENEIQNCTINSVFLRSTNSLDRLSRYETLIERRLQRAMQDLERLQTIRRAAAAEAATVIDVTDLNKDEDSEPPPG